ncbi:MAG: metal ABC transporter permease [Thermoguttaceae bacterium]
MSYLIGIVLIGTALLGSVAGVLGTFAVLRRRALVGDLISHAALPGLCLAFLILGKRHFTGMLLGAFCTGLAAIGLVSLVCRWTRTKDDAALGIALSVFFGAGIVLSSWIQNRPGGGARAGLESYIYGQAAGMIRRDVYLIAGVCAAALLVVALLYKQFKLLSFDPGFARAQGWPTLALDLWMMGTLALVIMVGLPAVGVVLMAAMLILPAATARFWTQRLGRMLILAGLLGGLTGAIGVLLSAGLIAAWLGFDPLAFGPSPRGLPPGPLIVLCGAIGFLFSVFFAPQRGLLARLARALRLRLAIGQENLLRSLYELSEPQVAQRPAIPVARLLERRAWGAGWGRWLVWLAARLGLVQRTADRIRLTEPGLVRARQLVRAHRLWELFLIRGADIAPDHVDRDADLVEHVLGPQTLVALERGLAGLTPASADQVPDSPHELPPVGQSED